jgi:hypothetical protein
LKVIGWGQILSLPSSAVARGLRFFTDRRIIS